MYSVKPLDIPREEKPVKGAELIPDLYSNIFLVSSSNSGKTTLLFHYLKYTLDPRSKVWIFSSTIRMDPSFDVIMNFLDKNHITYETFDSIISEDGTNNIELVLQTLDDIANEPEEEKYKPPPSSTNLIFQQTDSGLRLVLKEDLPQPESKVKSKKNYKDSVPENVFIFDDLSMDETRSPHIGNLMKKSRHYKARVFVSGQYFYQLSPIARAQLYQICMWKNMPDKNLKEIEKEVSGWISPEEFETVYRENTIKPYSFIVIFLKRTYITAGLNTVVFSR